MGLLIYKGGMCVEFYGRANTALSSEPSAWVLPKFARWHFFYSGTYRTANSENLEYVAPIYIQNYKRGAYQRTTSDGTYVTNNRNYMQMLLPIALLNRYSEIIITQPYGSLEGFLNQSYFNNVPEGTNYRINANNNRAGVFKINILETYNVVDPTVQNLSAVLYSNLKLKPNYNEALSTGIKNDMPRKKAAVFYDPSTQYYTVCVYKFDNADWMYNIISMCAYHYLQHTDNLFVEDPDNISETYIDLCKTFYKNCYTRNSIECDRSLTQLWETIQEPINNLARKTQMARTVQNIANYKINIVRNKIDALHNSVLQLEDDLLRKRQDLDRLRLEHIALTLNDSEKDSQILSNFLNNCKDIKELNFTNERLTVQILTPCTSYSSSILKKYLENPNIVNVYSKVLEAIFIEQKYTLYFKAHCTLNVRAQNVDATYDPEYMPELVTHGFPNPHIMIYNCFGTNRNIIQKNILENDYAMALMQLVGTIQNMNFADATVANRFFQQLNQNIDNCADGLKCIVDDDDNWYTFAEVLRKELEDATTTDSATSEL